MTEDKTSIKIEKETNNICEECKKLSESVKSNLIMSVALLGFFSYWGYK